jgi:hypothetical protein
MSARPKWLPRPAKARVLPDDPWCPPPLTRADAEDEALRYVIVEETVGDSLGLLVAAWPRAGADGLPAFADPEQDVEVGADRATLQRHVDRLRRPQRGLPRATSAALRRRTLALGDVFAAHVDAAALEAATRVAVADPAWITGPLLDVTAEARKAAREVFYEAVTPPLPEAAEQEIKEQLAKRRRS